MVDNKNWLNDLQIKIGMQGNFKGIVPMYCKLHNRIFMYNLDTKTSSLPRRLEDGEDCRLLALGLLSEKNDLTDEQKQELRNEYLTKKNVA